MTRFPHDQFAKSYLQELLATLGEVQIPRAVLSEARQIDVWFEPSDSPDPNRICVLGLFGRLLSTSCIFEPFRNPVSVDEICGCVSKYLDVRGEYLRAANRENEKLHEDILPKLWIITPTASEDILSGFGAINDEGNWGKGIYLLAKYFRGGMVVVHQLPKTPDTLWLRILGRGKVQQQAIQELQALPEDDLLKLSTLELFYGLTEILEARKQNQEEIENDDEDLIVQLRTIYQQKLESVRAEFQQQLESVRDEGLQQGERIVVEQLLKTRFGSLDEELLSIIEPLLLLPPEEFTPLLLQLSREQLLERFSQ